MDDVLGPGGQRRRLGEQGRLGFRRPGTRGQQTVAQQAREAQRAEPHARALEKLAPGQKMIFEGRRVFRLVLILRIHRLDI